MKECIILAGGLGTRLQSVVKDVPKCMAEVAAKPFIEYIFDYLAKYQFDHVILSLGFRSEVVIDWLEEKQRPFDISFVVEQEPLETGGAVKLAFTKVKKDIVMIINGDTFFDICPDDLYAFHEAKHSDLSIALKPMIDFDRYGSVTLNKDYRIIEFREKRFCEKGLINGGVYLTNKNIFDGLDFPDKFSFEKDVMEAKINQLGIFGSIHDSYFIDIGIPTDFEKANRDFKIIFDK